MSTEILELLRITLLYYLVFPLPLLFVALLIITGITGIWITFRKSATSGTPEVKDSKAATYLIIAVISAPLGAGISGLIGFGAICAGSLPLLEPTQGQVGYLAVALLGLGLPLAIALGTIGAIISAMISRALFSTFSPFTTAAVVAALIGFLAPQFFWVIVFIYVGAHPELNAAFFRINFFV